MFVSILIVVTSSIKTFFMCFTGLATRKFIDQECRRFSHRLLKAVRTSFTVVNPHQVDIQQYTHCVLMANHSSHYDIPLCIAALPGSIRMLAKKELGRIPLFGKALQMAEFPLVDRQNPRQAVKDLKKAEELMRSGIIIWVAPEGKRSTTDQLQPLKRGGFSLAIKTKATIIPIAIYGSRKILPTKTLKFGLHQHVEIRIGAPIDASTYNLQNAKALMGKVTNVMQQLLYTRDLSKRALK
ncbi:MAG: lysophospholipid acyltransferase family protein [Gammaproteobacteria bacterium]